MNTLAILVFLGVLVSIIFFSIAAIYRGNQIEKEKIRNVKDFIERINKNKTINKVSSSLKSPELEKIFFRARNPWRMNVETFQFIRYGGLAAFTVIAIGLLMVDKVYAMICFGVAIICCWYPIYYYKSMGDEREAEWNKSYEFIWVIKHNIMLYDPKKAFMEVKLYIQEHAPHNKELIRGFHDFYKHWSAEEIDEYVEKFYPFSVTREICQIIFNMSKTGQFPEDSLNALRGFIINSQNLTVEKTLSGVAGKATIFSLPFLMLSVIVAIMVPLFYQLLKFI